MVYLFDVVYMLVFFSNIQKKIIGMKAFIEICKTREMNDLNFKISLFYQKAFILCCLSPEEFTKFIRSGVKSGLVHKISTGWRNSRSLYSVDDNGNQIVNETWRCDPLYQELIGVSKQIPNAFNVVLNAFTT